MEALTEFYSANPKGIGEALSVYSLKKIGEDQATIFKPIR